ncbi:MAG TPA: hypothetical protein VLJ41_15930 [Segetibacter sp.]|nr:hypothetical protein [Segetibacter sp.]
MRKSLLFLALSTCLVACNSSGSSGNSDATKDTANETGLTNPSSVDTTKHPDGVINGSVISTDTAAINVQNSIDKGKEAKTNK